jgi:hypothetical protein
MESTVSSYPPCRFSDRRSIGADPGRVGAGAMIAYGQARQPSAASDP